MDVQLIKNIKYLRKPKNPLEFWQQHKETFPDLYKLSLKYLCIPATSFSSERVFFPKQDSSQTIVEIDYPRKT